MSGNDRSVRHGRVERVRPRRHPFLLRHLAHNENKPTRSPVRSEIQGPGLLAHHRRGAHGPSRPYSWICLEENEFRDIPPGPPSLFLGAAQQSSNSVAGSSRSHCVRSLDPPTQPPFLRPAVVWRGGGRESEENWVKQAPDRLRSQEILVVAVVVGGKETNKQTKKSVFCRM